MLLKVDCLPYAVGKQPSIPLIYLGRKWTLNWWWWSEYFERYAPTTQVCLELQTVIVKWNVWVPECCLPECCWESDDICWWKAIVGDLTTQKSVQDSFHPESFTKILSDDKYFFICTESTKMYKQVSNKHNIIYIYITSQVKITTSDWSNWPSVTIVYYTNI